MPPKGAKGAAAAAAAPAPAVPSGPDAPVIKLPNLSDSLPQSEHMKLLSVSESSSADFTFSKSDDVITFTADGKFKIPINRGGLMRFVSSYRLLREAQQQHATEQQQEREDAEEWKLADPITATKDNLAYLASWINYYGAQNRNACPQRIPSCVTYPIFLGPPDYVLDAADYLFVEKVILEGKGLGEKRIMRLISLGEFCAAIDCGMLRDIVSGYIAAKVREADENYVEGVGPAADVVVKSWFGKEGGLTDAEFDEAKKKFGDDAFSGKDWQEHDRRARAAQKNAGVLPLQPYE